MTPLARMLDERAHANRAAITRLRTGAAWVPGAAVAVVVACVVGVVSNLLIGVVAGLAAGVAVGWWRWQAAGENAVPVLLDVLGARPATEAEFPRYLNLVDGLTITSGIKTPALYVLDDPGANAAALGAGGGAALVLTTGLLEGVGRVELEGVLAEQLSRIRILEADLASRAAVLVCGSVLRTDPAAATPAQRSKVARLEGLLGDQRHFLADMSASSMTRYPPGLRDGLIRMSEGGTALRNVTLGTAHLWMCDPLPRPSSDEPATTDHPPIQHRIDLLAEL